MLSLLLLVLVIIVMAGSSRIKGGEDDMLGIFKFGLHIWILGCEETLK